MVISKGMVALATAAVTALVLYPKSLKEVKTVQVPEIEDKKSSKSESRAFKKIERLNLNRSRIVYLTGPINQASAQVVIQELKKLDLEGAADINMLIDSPGGSVFDGAMIISTMEGLRSKVNTICTAMCASMAFIIHQHGSTRMMVDRALLMSHPAYGGTPKS